MIEIKNVSQSYIDGKKVIDNMNLNIENGIVFGFIGPNGTGKTTTIEMITGILNIDEGDIFIDGKSIKNNPIEAKKRFGFVPDVPDAFEKLTGIEYLNFIGDIYNVPSEERMKVVKKLSNEFEIVENLNNRILSYSHGMKQKLLIIGVLLHNPQNWILDEPMTGLDPKASYILKKLMKEHSQKGNTVFFSTHVLEVAEKICDKIAVIDKGKIIFTGTCDELKEKVKTSTSLEESFLKILDNKNDK